MCSLICTYRKAKFSYMLAHLTHINSTPFGKFFLLVFVQCYGDCSPRMASAKELYGYLGLPKVKFYEAVRELQDKEILEVKRSSPRELPWVQYRISAPDIAANVRTSLRQHRYSALITQLLRWAQDRLESRPHQLTIPQRILMIALLEHAEQGGIVRQAGFAKLSELSGLSLRQTKNQIRLLIQYQYIRCSSPGGNNPKFIGRFNSTYLLNLRHPSYGSDIRPGSTVICRQAVPWPWPTDENLNIAERLRHQLRKLWPELTRYIRRAPPPASWKFLHWLIYDLASKSLTENWNGLTQRAFGATTEQLADDVHELCFPQPPLADGELEHAILDFCQLVATNIFVIACGAKEIMSACSFSARELKNQRYQILPPSFRHERNAGIAIEVFATHLGSTSSYRTWKVWLDVKSRKPAAEEMESPNSLSPSELAKLGLATPPFKQPALYRVKPRKDD